MERITLREARARRGLTQEQLAEASGVEQAQISALERCRISDPRFSTVCKLARGLRMDPRALKFGQPESMERAS